MLIKSYIFRLIVMCTIGMFPLLGYSGSADAANVGIIKGKVTGQRTNASMNGVDIRITDLNGKVVKKVKSQKDGTYTVSQMPIGQYNVKAGKAPAKSVQVAMSPPVTQVDFRVPERGYMVFSGLSKKQKIVGAAVAAIILGVTTYLIVDDSSSSNRVGVISSP